MRTLEVAKLDLGGLVILVWVDSNRIGLVLLELRRLQRKKWKIVSSLLQRPDMFQLHVASTYSSSFDNCRHLDALFAEQNARMENCEKVKR